MCLMKWQTFIWVHVPFLSFPCSVVLEKPHRVCYVNGPKAAPLTQPEVAPVWFSSSQQSRAIRGHSTQISTIQFLKTALAINVVSHVALTQCMCPQPAPKSC